RALTPSDDERGDGRAIVLSHRAWSGYFVSDPGILTRTVVVNGAPFEVVGVMPEAFRGLTVAAPDFWAPLSAVGHFRRVDAGQDRTSGIGIVGRLKPGLSRERSEERRVGKEGR